MAGSAPTGTAIGKLLAAGRRWSQRVWAVEGCNRIGRHRAQRLVADGETMVDVPAKLSARARVFSTGYGRKTDAVPAAAGRMAGRGERAEGTEPGIRSW